MASADGAASPDAGDPAPDLGGPTADQATASDSVLPPDAAPKTCAPTGNDALGPFYQQGAPSRTTIAGPTEPGDRVTIAGTVYGPDCTTPIAGATLDIWHADATGQYHAAGTTYRLRGVLKTDAKGTFEFQTIKPGHYDNRPRHYHLIVSSPGHVALTTQIYFQGDPLLGPKDSCQPPTCKSGDPGRVIPLKPTGTRQGKPHERGTFDVVLVKL